MFYFVFIRRTASDLEELGYIDKAQKGLIKDLIISGDTKLQALMDKYEQGDGYELLGNAIFVFTRFSGLINIINRLRL